MDNGLKPYLYVEINNVDVSAYITPYLTDFRYIDNDGLHNAQSDDIEITVEDVDKFFSNNPPARGSSLKVKFGYEDKVRDAGIFYIDTYEFMYSRAQGRLFRIKALAKDVKSSFREIKTVAFENTSLAKVAQEIANKHGYKLVFNAPDVLYKRLTQHQKRDLEFLKELCHLYGYTLKVNNKTIVIKDPSIADRIYVLTPDNITNLNIKVSSLYDDTVKVEYLEPDKKQKLQGQDKANIKASGSTLKVNHRVENTQQAQKIAQAQARLNKMKEVKGTIECIGIPDLYASGKIAIEGFGAFDNEYYISSITHQITRNGYTCSLEVLKSV